MVVDEDEVEFDFDNDPGTIAEVAARIAASWLAGAPPVVIGAITTEA